MIKDFLSPMGAKRRFFWILLCLVQASFFAYIIYFFCIKGYLPSPLPFDKYDTFMDFFHTMYWADRDGRYVEWGAVYPPLNFLFLQVLRFIFLGDDTPSTPFMLRERTVCLQLFFLAAYFLIPSFVVTRNYWRKLSGEQKLYVYIIAVLSGPMLFALERGNLILLALIFLPFLFARAPWKRIIGLTVLVNLKPYFVILFFVYVIKRRWNELFLATLSAGSFYLVTCLILGTDPLLLLANLFSYSQQNAMFSPREVLAMPSSLSVFSYVIAFEQLRGGANLTWNDWRLVGVYVDLLKWCLYIFCGYVMVYYGRSLSIKQVFAALLLMIANIGVWVGGYTLVFLLALVPIFASMRLRYFYITALALIALPLDLIPLIQENGGSQQYSYLGGQQVRVDWLLGPGSIVRPVLDFLMLAGVTWELTGRRIIWRAVCVSSREKIASKLHPISHKG